MEYSRFQTLSREGNELAFDEMTLEECNDMHEVMGMNFVTGDGKIQAIETPIAGRYPMK